MKSKIQDGASINYTPTADIAGNSLVIFPALAGVAITDIAAGETGALATEGVFDLPKDGTALAIGQAVFAGADGKVSATQEGNALRVGVAWADAAGNTSSVPVKINA